MFTVFFDLAENRNKIMQNSHNPIFWNTLCGIFNCLHLVTKENKRWKDTYFDRHNRSRLPSALSRMD